MLDGGGTQVLATNGNEIRPGGEDLFGDGDRYLAYHCYDAKANGAPKLRIRAISYPNGWRLLSE